MTPSSLLNLHLEFGQMMIEAQTVVALRMLGMGGVIPSGEDENSRMIKEKPRAWLDAVEAGTKAMLSGQPADQVMSASLAPVGRKVRANRNRLMSTSS